MIGSLSLLSVQMVSIQQRIRSFRLLNSPLICTTKTKKKRAIRKKTFKQSLEKHIQLSSSSVDAIHKKEAISEPSSGFVPLFLEGNLVIQDSPVPTIVGEAFFMQKVRRCFPLYAGFQQNLPILQQSSTIVEGDSSGLSGKVNAEIVHIFPTAKGQSRQMMKNVQLKFDDFKV